MDILKNGAANGIDYKKSTSYQECVACIEGKTVRPPYPLNSRKAKIRLELIHTNLCQMPEAIIGGVQYFIIFLDDFSRQLFVYPIKHKHETLKVTKHLLNYTKNQCSETVKTVLGNNGTKYISD